MRINAEKTSMKLIGELVHFKKYNEKERELYYVLRENTMYALACPTYKDANNYWWSVCGVIDCLEILDICDNYDAFNFKLALSDLIWELHK